MSSNDFVIYALQVAVMLAMALVSGQIMRRFHQPPVLGEMIGGIFLGPTVLGLLAPGFYAWLFESSANVGVLRDATILGKPDSPETAAAVGPRPTGTRAASVGASPSVRSTARSIPSSSTTRRRASTRPGAASPTRPWRASATSTRRQ